MKARTKFNQDGSVNRIIEASNGDFAVDLFPYKIQNRELFYDRNHPVNISPESFEYELYWGERLKNYLEGRWVYDVDTWVFMPPKLDFYINYVIIVDEDRKKIPPRLRDNEWIMSYYDLCAEGFSGFELDEEYTCHELVGKIEKIQRQKEQGDKNPDEIKEFEKKILDSSTTILREDGTYKKFIPAWEYLTEHYLITHKADKPLGSALYENNKSDEMILACRAVAKSFYTFGGNFMHEWLTNGTKTVEDFIKDGSTQKLFAAGSVRKDQLERSMSIVKRFYNSMPGNYTYGVDDKGKEDKVFGFLYKSIVGTWDVGTKVEHKVPNTDNTIAISGNVMQLSVITPDAITSLAGDRMAMIIIEEVGFLSYVKRVRSAFRNSLRVGKKKIGKALYLGCVCAGSKVWNNNGDLVSIENLTQEEGIVGYDSKNDCIAKQPISYMQPPQEKQCYRITTNTGRFIECSEDHPIYARRRWENTESTHLKKNCEWIRADELKVNEAVAIIDKVDIWSDKKMFDPYLIGMLVGDGTYGETGMPRLSNSDDEVWNYINSNHKTTIYSESIGKNGKNLRKGSIKGVKDELVKLGIFGQTKLNKRLPDNIHSYCKEDVCDFLAGYFDADGCVSINKKGDYATIKATSISEPLIKELQLILNKLGIHGRIQKSEPRISKLASGKYPTYNLYIKDRKSIIAFCENIKLKIDYKQKNLERAYKIALNKKDYTLQGIDNLRFETITSIEDIGYQPIYNLTADGTNTYIVNGIQTHNTGGDMEAIQDAKEMFESPDGFEIYALPNYFDKNRAGSTGLFLSACLQSEEFKDENGNTIYEQALGDVIDQREREFENSDSTSFWEFVAFNPLYPREMLRPSSKSVLPVIEMTEHRGVLMMTDIWKHRSSIGTFRWDPTAVAKVSWRRDVEQKMYPINDWGKDKELHNREGAWIMYEDVMENRPDNLYYILYDPAAQGGEGTSLHSALVYKHRFTGGNKSLQETFIAEFIGRKPKLEQNYEEIIRAALYYNAKILVERNVPGFSEWCESKGYYHLLLNEPTRVLTEVRRQPVKYSGRKGIRTDDAINKWNITKLGEWLRDPIMEDEDGTPIKFRFQSMYSLRLLDEAINFKMERKTEFDHMSSAMLLMPLLLEISDESIEIVDDFEDINKSKYSKYSQIDYGIKKRSKFLETV